MQLHEKLEAVSDAASFLCFVQALIEDRKSSSVIDICGRSSNGWENHSIDDFLEAALAWAEATGVGATQGLADSSPWKRFAVFLYCGKIYE